MSPPEQLRPGAFIAANDLPSLCPRCPPAARPPILSATSQASLFLGWIERVYRSRPAPVQCIDLIVNGPPLKAPPLKAAPLKAAQLNAAPFNAPPLGWTTPGVKVRPPHPPLSDRSDPPHPPLKAVPTLKAAPPRLYWVIEPLGLRWIPPPGDQRWIPPPPNASPLQWALSAIDCRAC